ncbi:MAG: hypothetical protein Q4G59_10125, partial [Planctomycetia bacterium]|nr:hypothetical protein [Planctomycetia bacterium]
LLFEWTELPRERYSWEMMIQRKPSNTSKTTQVSKPRIIQKSQLLELQKSLRDVDMLIDLYLRYWNRLTVLRQKAQAAKQPNGVSSLDAAGGRFLLILDLLASRLDDVLSKSIPGEGVTPLALECNVRVKLHERVNSIVLNNEYIGLRPLLSVLFESFTNPMKGNKTERKNK